MLFWNDENSFHGGGTTVLALCTRMPYHVMHDDDKYSNNKSRKQHNRSNFGLLTPFPQRYNVTHFGGDGTIELTMIDIECIH